MLRHKGWRVNHKRVERIGRLEGLKVPKRQPKRGRLWLNDGSCVRLRPEHKDHVWAYDFVSARTHDGRAFKMLTILDEAGTGLRVECVVLQRPGHRSKRLETGVDDPTEFLHAVGKPRVKTRWKLFSARMRCVSSGSRATTSR